jgi:Tfp pilus assembly protein PilO
MPRTQLEKLWLLGGCIVGLLVVIIGYFFFIGPQRSDTSSVNGLVATAKSQNATLQSRIDALQQQSKDLPKYQADLVQARLALPSTSGLPDFLRTLQSIGNSTLANVTSLSVLQPSDVSKIAVTARPNPAATSSSASSSSSSSSSASGSSGTPGADGANVGGIKVYALPISATIAGSPAQLTAFLTQLQRVQPRAVLISAITLATDQGKAAGSGPSSAPATLQLTMQAFVAPSSAAESAALSQAAAK